MVERRVAQRKRRPASPDSTLAAAKPALPPAAPEAPRFDAIVHERTRLGIVGALAARGRLSFAELKSIMRTTDGNLSAHARKLEDAGYVSTTKRFEGRTPRTEFELTPAGKEALERYLAHMEALIRTVRHL